MKSVSEDSNDGISAEVCGSERNDVSNDTALEPEEMPFWDLDGLCAESVKPAMCVVRGKVKCVVSGMTANSGAYCIAVLLSTEVNPVCGCGEEVPIVLISFVRVGKWSTLWLW